MMYFIATATLIQASATPVNKKFTISWQMQEIGHPFLAGAALDLLCYGKLGGSGGCRAAAMALSNSEGKHTQSLRVQDKAKSSVLMHILTNPTALFFKQGQF